MDTIKMKAIADGHQRISDKIRALHKAGYKRTEIADFTGRRYQQVRNVIKDDERRAAARASAVSQKPDQGSVISLDAAAGSSTSSLIRVSSGGVVEIPLALLDQLGVAEGDPLFAYASEDEIVLVPRDAMVTRLKRAISDGSPQMIALVDALAQA